MANAEVIAQATTRMTRMRVEQQGRERHLKFERDTDAVQSAIDMQQPSKLVMENLQYLMGLLLFVPAPRKVLLLGVGGGSLIHFLRAHLPNTHIIAVEYDAELLEFAQQHLALPAADEHLTYYIEDARRFVEHDKQLYDLVLVDIFDAGATPPWMRRKPFNASLQQRLSAHGALGYNLIIDSEPTFKRFYQMLRSQYRQQTLCLETEEYANLLVYALNYSAPSLTMAQILDQCLELGDQFDLPFVEIVASIFRVNPQGSGII
jgi:spermidine synthase